MCALYEYDIMKSTGKLRFARGTHENLIYLPRPPAVSERVKTILNKLPQNRDDKDVKVARVARADEGSSVLQTVLLMKDSAT